MGLLGGNKPGPIGIDLGGRAIKAVQLANLRGHPRVHAAAIVPLPVPNHPFDPHSARHLRDVLFRHGFAGDNIVLAAPANQLEIDVLELPPRSSGAPVEQIARVELARTARIENEPFELDCWDLPANARSAAATCVMAVGLRHKHANELIDPFDAEGFHVIAIDAWCCALARAASAYDSPDTITAVLDIGWNTTQIVLIRDGVVAYQRVLREAGLGVVFRALTGEFQLAEDEADYVLRHVGLCDGPSAELADVAQWPRVRDLIGRHFETVVNEIQAAFQYVIHRHPQSPVKHLLPVGGGASLAGICEFLSLRLNVDVSVLSPVKIAECPGSLAARCADGVLTAALGLARHGAK